MAEMDMRDVVRLAAALKGAKTTLSDIWLKWPDWPQWLRDMSVELYDAMEVLADAPVYEDPAKAQVALLKAAGVAAAHIIDAFCIYYQESALAEVMPWVALACAFRQQQ